MSDVQLINDTATRMLEDHCDYAAVQAAEDGTWPDALRATLADSGLLRLGLEESGTGVVEAMSFLQVAGRYAVPMPIAEQIAVQMAVGAPADATGLAVVEGGGARITWPERLEDVVLIDGASNRAMRVRIDALDLEPARTLAGEPAAYARVTNFAALPGATVGGIDLYSLGALGRCALMCGALTQVLDLAITYAGEREQFGRSISKFQAIQHNLAVVAAEVAAAGRATDAAIASVGASGIADIRVSDVAVAKIRVGEAAGICAEAAHQVHGAMGFTLEHRLHHFTRRLWQWRDEFGTEQDWCVRLGAEICERDADELWSFVTSHG